MMPPFSEVNCVSLSLSLLHIFPTLSLSLSLRRDYSHLADCWEALARRHWTNIDTTTLTG